ncbi:ABC transporter substrate-binding protein [Cohnella fermenti]|uniref:DUF3502 domain-containing protein n=1 Tax=Cohnella fermenti TaxID=2565925 RepID=A0A4V3WF72_9BACL|nr:ABC transporter substrate-binding protein [Cohnella fermenti]THF79126.1 DUF3502 domain-containing protein [Cohnella fermenti]
MHVKRKRLLALTTAVVLSAAMLASGCSSSNGNGNGNSQGQSAATESAGAAGSGAGEGTAASEAPKADTSEFVKLKYYYTGPTSPGDDAVFAELNKRIKEKINANVEFIKVASGDYTQKMSIMVNALEEFDLVFTSPYYLNYYDNASKGAFVDITDLLPVYAPETYALFKPEIWDAARVNGKIYASINQQIFARQSGFSVQKALADKYGFDPTTVKKLSDIAPFLQSVKDGEPAETTDQLWNAQVKNQVFSYFYPAYEWESIGEIDLPGVVRSMEDNPKVFNEYETEEFKDFVLTNADFQKRGFIAKDTLTRPTFDPAKYVGTAMATLSPGVDATIAQTYKAEHYVIPMGSPMLTSANAIATLTAVSATSKHPERALMFIELLNTDKEIYNMLVWGLEGVDYVKTGDNRIEAVEGSSFKSQAGWKFGNQFNSYVTGTQTDDVWEQTDELNKSAKMSKLFGFSFNPEQVKSEIANTMAIVAEYRQAFNAGMYGDDTEAKLQEYNQKLKSAGVDKIIAEKQRQLDEFIAQKG